MMKTVGHRSLFLLLLAMSPLLPAQVLAADACASLFSLTMRQVLVGEWSRLNLQISEIEDPALRSRFMTERKRLTEGLLAQFGPQVIEEMKLKQRQLRREHNQNRQTLEETERSRQRLLVEQKPKTFEPMEFVEHVGPFIDANQALVIAGGPNAGLPSVYDLKANTITGLDAPWETQRSLPVGVSADRGAALLYRDNALTRFELHSKELTRTQVVPKWEAQYVDHFQSGDGSTLFLKLIRDNRFELHKVRLTTGGSVVHWEQIPDRQKPDMGLQESGDGRFLRLHDGLGKFKIFDLKNNLWISGAAMKQDSELSIRTSFSADFQKLWFAEDGPTNPPSQVLRLMDIQSGQIIPKATLQGALPALIEAMATPLSPGPERLLIVGQSDRNQTVAKMLDTTTMILNEFTIEQGPDEKFENAIVSPKGDWMYIFNVERQTTAALPAERWMYSIDLKSLQVFRSPIDFQGSRLYQVTVAPDAKTLIFFDPTKKSYQSLR